MRLQIGAAFWVLCVQFLFAEQIASHAWRIPYSFARNYISDLGAIDCDARICSPLHAAMNASFSLQGLLIGLGAILLWPYFRSFERLALSLLVVCGAGVIMVGFVPEDTVNWLHIIGAASHFVSGGLGICLMGISALRNGKDRTMGWLSILSGLAVLTATILLGERHSLAWGIFEYPGIIERVASYCITAWMSGMGILTWISLSDGQRLRN